MTPEQQIMLIAVVTAVAAALPGTYLVLRRTALVSDAISHAILPGIVIAFFLTHDLNSPFLLVSAAATGVLTVFLIEALHRSRLVPEDASIGLVFPALFSVGVILISRYAGDVHLDTDSVLLGELALAPFDPSDQPDQWDDEWKQAVRESIDTVGLIIKHHHIYLNSKER